MKNLITIAGILTVAALTGMLSTSAYGDESETNTEFYLTTTSDLYWT